MAVKVAKKLGRRNAATRDGQSTPRDLFLDTAKYGLYPGLFDTRTENTYLPSGLKRFMPVEPEPWPEPNYRRRTVARDRYLSHTLTAVGSVLPVQIKHTHTHTSGRSLCVCVSVQRPTR